MGRSVARPCRAANSARVIVAFTTSASGWPDKINGHARVTIDFFFERKDHDHVIDASLHDSHAARAPGPHLRSDEIAHWNCVILQTPRDAQVRSRRIDENCERRFPADGFAREHALHANHGWDFVQHFSDADDGDFVIIRDEFDACLGHSRAAHAKELRAGAFAQGDREAGRIHIAGSFTGGDQDLRWRHASDTALIVGGQRLGRAEGIRASDPSGRETASSCSLYWSW